MTSTQKGCVEDLEMCHVLTDSIVFKLDFLPIFTDDGGREVGEGWSKRNHSL